MPDLCAYFDASGSFEDDSITVLSVAGYISTEERWAGFEREWSSILASEGVSALHMRHFAHSRGEFEGWKNDEKRRVRLLSKLAKVIGECTIRSFSMNLLLEDYRIVNRMYKLYEYAPPYVLASERVVSDLSKWISASYPNSDFRVLFEKGDPDQEKLLPLFSAWGVRLPTDVEFVEKAWTDANSVRHINGPLQASDFLAYEQNKALTDFLKFGKVHVRGSIYSLLKATDSIGLAHKALGGKFFRSVCEVMKISRR